MTTFVLLHGAWHGGWCWRRVRERLRAQGFDVLTPTLTGLSDRAHTLSPTVDLSTHVEDVVQLVESEDLKDVVLVGHSYAGMVVSGVCERVAERVKRRVYLDAFLPRDGESAIDLLPQQVRHHYRESVAGAGFGWLIPPRSLEVLGVEEPEDLKWLTPRLTPHPWASYVEPLTLTGAGDSVPGSYVECVSWMRVFAPYADRARGLGWNVHELATGHEAMVTAPVDLTRALVEITSG